jgi:WbqC-like protein family
MIVSIMQPAYLPWLGYFDRLARSDLHIVLDSVALSKQNFTNRNRVRGSTGPVWLSVPVQRQRADQRITDTLIGPDHGWMRKHWETLRQSYRRAPHWERYAGFLETFYQSPRSRLVEVLDPSTAWLRETLAITTPIVRASTLDVPGTKAELVLQLCLAVGATTYLSGPFGRDYLDPRAFDAAGIALEYHDYVHPRYPQRDATFEPYLSVLDLLCHCGPDSFDILRGRRTDVSAQATSVSDWAPSPVA